MLKGDKAPAFGPEPSSFCKMCGKAVKEGESHRKLKQQLIQGRVSENDPVVGYVHEVCALTQEKAALQEQASQLSTLLAAALDRFGCELKFTREDLTAIDGRDIFNVTADAQHITVSIPKVVAAKGPLISLPGGRGG